MLIGRRFVDSFDPYELDNIEHDFYSRSENCIHLQPGSVLRNIVGKHKYSSFSLTDTIRKSRRYNRYGSTKKDDPLNGAVDPKIASH